MSRFIILFLVLFGVPICAYAQSIPASYIVISDIQFKGLKKTKERIVRRELDFVEGDTLQLSTLTAKLQENEKRLLSTALFNIVKSNIENWDTEAKKATVSFTFVEAWYLYPVPIFELADRNFNVWWNEQGRSLDRVDYGIRFDHINLTGRRDYLKLKYQLGYTRKYELKYTYPYLDKAQQWGIITNLFYADNRELSYVTLGNKPTFFSTPDDRRILKRLRLGAELTRRSGLYAYHSFKLEYHNNRVDQVVADLNPDYFFNGNTGLKFLFLQYQYRIDKRHFFQYPDDGWSADFTLKQEGLSWLGNFSNTAVLGSLEYYHSFNDRWIWASNVRAKTNITRDPIAFANNTGLGYVQDFIRGYELYVQDGTDYVHHRMYLSFKFLDKLLNFDRYMPVHQFKLLSLKSYIRGQIHLGYAHEPRYTDTNEQNNRLLIGYGPALDILMYNNFLFQIEYTYNHLGESGLYIHNEIAF